MHTRVDVTFSSWFEGFGAGGDPIRCIDQYPPHGATVSNSSRSTNLTVGCLLLLLLVGRPLPAEAQVQPPTWRLEEVARIGGVHGSLSLTEMSSVTTSAGQDTLYIAQPQQSAIWMIDIESRSLIARIGRTGDGPGEFRRLDYLGWSNDTLYATDGLAGRVSLFTSAGEYLRDIQLTPTSLPGVAHIAYPVALADSGRLIAQSRLTTTAVANGVTKQDPVALLTPDGTVVRLLAFRNLTGTFVTLPLGRAVTWAYQPFSVPTLIGIDRRRGSVAVVNQPVRDEPAGKFEVRLVRADGSVVFDRTYRYTPQRVSPAFADSIYEAETQKYAETGFVTRDRAREVVREHLHIPSSFPAFAGVVISDEGEIWLRAHADRSRTAGVVILDQRGDIRARALVPANTKLLAIGPMYVWGQVYNELDVPILVQYRIVRDG